MACKKISLETKEELNSIIEKELKAQSEQKEKFETKIIIYYFERFDIEPNHSRLTNEHNTTTTTAMVYDGEVLPLTKVSRNEMGAYLCIATNGVPPSVSKRIILDVECNYK